MTIEKSRVEFNGSPTLTDLMAQDSLRPPQPVISVEAETLAYGKHYESGMPQDRKIAPVQFENNHTLSNPSKAIAPIGKRKPTFLLDLKYINLEDVDLNHKQTALINKIKSMPDDMVKLAIVAKVTGSNANEVGQTLHDIYSKVDQRNKPHLSAGFSRKLGRVKSPISSLGEIKERYITCRFNPTGKNAY